MQTVTFTPDHIHTYQASIERLATDDHTVRFGFGLVDNLTTVVTTTDGEPNSFGHFCRRWNTTAIAGNGPDLWAGFMAFRYVLGYFSQWVLLPPELIHQARHPTATTTTPPQDIANAVRDWDGGWEQQLQPLCEALQQPVTEAIDHG